MEILVFSTLDGLTLDYVYEFAGDTLTIWFGHSGLDNLLPLFAGYCNSAVRSASACAGYAERGN